MAITGYTYNYWAGTAGSATAASTSWINQYQAAVGNHPYQTFVYGEWKPMPVVEEKDEILDKLFQWED